MTYIKDANFAPAQVEEKLPEGQPKQNSGYVDEILKLRREKTMEQMVKAELGLGEKKSDGSENLAATIVTKAMELSAKANDRVQELADRNDKAVQQARIEADKAKSDLLAITAQQIGGAMQEIKEMRQEIKMGSQPKSATEQIKELLSLLDVIRPQQKEPPPQVVSGPDPNVAIQLERMKNDHDAQMKTLDIELQKMSNAFQIELKKIANDEAYKRQEYEDSKAFRNNTLTTIGDAAAAFAAGMGGGAAGAAPAAAAPAAEGVPIAAPTAPPAPEQPAPQVKARVIAFNCQGCQTRITVPDGATTVSCGNCGAEYGISKE